MSYEKQGGSHKIYKPCFSTAEYKAWQSDKRQPKKLSSEQICQMCGQAQHLFPQLGPIFGTSNQQF